MKNRLAGRLVVIAIAWFLFLCLFNYFAQKEGMDEGYILNNIKELSIPQLFGQLKFDQVFPRVYLASISLLAGQFSYCWLALRFLPLLFMLLGFFIWVYLYKLESKNNFFWFLLIFSFASSIFTSYYAAQLKQYSGDLFVVAFYTLFIYYQRKYLSGSASIKYLWLFSLFAPLLILFSHMSFLMLGMVVYNYAFLLKKDKRSWAPFSAYLIITFAVALFVLLFDIRYSLGIKFMQDYWRNCFIDTRSPYAFIKTFSNGLQNIFVRWFLEKSFTKSIAAIFMPFALVALFLGFKASWRKYQGAVMDLNLICGVLLLELFVLGVFKVYVFSGARITMFIAPFIFYLIVRGIYLTEKTKFLFLSLLGLYLVFLSGVSTYLFFFYLKFYRG
ncbi:MAG: hypothetical protein WC628_08080 [Candidatus Omnitrophota bacterium]